MNKAYAFFDVDGTVISGKSMFDFHDFWYRNGADPANSDEHEDVSAILRSLSVSGASREQINRRYYEFFAGRTVSSVATCAKAWAEQALAKPGFFVRKVVQRLTALRQDGVEPVFVSGSFVELLGPIAKALDVRYVLATHLLNDGQKYSGRIAMPQTIGAGKALAIHSFLADQEVDSRNCWAFGDDISDVPMLELVGHPTAVIGDQELAMVATIQGWPSIKLDEE